jgi:peptidoglycan/LPS O-acetylase OafA/YrhL
MSSRTAQASSGDRGRIGSLDGLRALSIVAVLLYHGGVGWADGGFLGVEVFFVLSGFLITSLLIGEWTRTAGIALKRFWARRARRLLPALFMMVTVVGVVYATTLHDAQVPGLQGDGLAALLYVANWHELATGAGYFAANGPVSPLTHTWSLAVEEQFYLAWPPIVLVALWLCGRRRVAPRRALGGLLAICLLGVLGSAVDMTLQLHGGGGLDRVYYGTDTRAAGLLLGAGLAVVLALRDQDRSRAGRRQPGRSSFAVLVVSLVALASVLAAMHWANGTALWLYPYGLLGVDVAVLILITTCVLAPAAVVTRIFSLRPIRALGVISYGVYLWHFPLFLWLTTASTGLSGALLLVFRVLVTLAVSTLSYVLIERPVRQRRIPNLVTCILAPVAAAGAVASLVFAAAVEASALQSSSAPVNHGQISSLAGDQQPCTVHVTDTSAYGVLPLGPTAAALDEPAWLVGHKLRWQGSGALQFRTCPPKRVLVIGDSIAFTLGVGLMENEQAYGVEVADAAILGCAFNNQGQLNSRGKWEDQYAGCPNALQEWAADETRFHAQAVVVELGYRDEFDWRWGARAMHIGEPAFDAYVRARIQQYIDVLGRGGVPILFVTVPWSNPAALPDGSPAPASSPARHAWIDAQLEAAAAASSKHVAVLDIDKVVSPGDHYTATIDGKLCRFDGVHLTVFCSQLLQSPVLTAVRRLIDRSPTA